MYHLKVQEDRECITRADVGLVQFVVLLDPQSWSWPCKKQPLGQWSLQILTQIAIANALPTCKSVQNMGPKGWVLQDCLEMFWYLHQPVPWWDYIRDLCSSCFWKIQCLQCARLRNLLQFVAVYWMIWCGSRTEEKYCKPIPFVKTRRSEILHAGARISQILVRRKYAVCGRCCGIITRCTQSRDERAYNTTCHHGFLFDKFDKHKTVWKCIS